MVRNGAIAFATCTLLAVSANAGDPSCKLDARISRLREVLSPAWLSIRPEQIKKGWLRPLERVPTGCESVDGECLFLGTASVSPGRTTSAGECSEAFIFNADAKGAPMVLTSATMTHTFPSLKSAAQGVELLSRVMQPPPGACPFVLIPWGQLERGRECHWAADGEWLISLSFRLSRRSSVWEAEITVSRVKFA